MTTPRLKLNRSRPPELLAGDLLIASALPVSINVHQFTLVLLRSGDFEFVDQISGEYSSQHFAGHLDKSQFVKLENQLGGLAASMDWLSDINLEGVDPELYESNDRRNIKFWHNNDRSGCAYLNPDYYNSIGIDSKIIKSFVQQFDKLWVEIITMVPNAFIELGPTRKFPLQSNPE